MENEIDNEKTEYWLKIKFGICIYIHICDCPKKSSEFTDHNQISIDVY